MNSRKRRALMVERGVTVVQVAKDTDSSIAHVSRVVHGQVRGETEKTQLIKQAIAFACGRDVTQMWPAKKARRAAAGAAR